MVARKRGELGALGVSYSNLKTLRWMTLDSQCTDLFFFKATVALLYRDTSTTLTFNLWSGGFPAG
jgi:hypothetical protein